MVDLPRGSATASGSDFFSRSASSNGTLLELVLGGDLLFSFFFSHFLHVVCFLLLTILGLYSSKLPCVKSPRVAAPTTYVVHTTLLRHSRPAPQATV
jgi:hypothetical protein